MYNEFILIGLRIAFVILLWLVLRLIYQILTKPFSNEIEDYLEKQNLTFKNKRKPNNSDWQDSPFKKPPLIKFSLATLKVGGIRIPIEDEKHYILETKENETIWIKEETTFLLNPKLSFKRSPTKKPPRSQLEIGNQETFKCPACNYDLIVTDDDCPDCGLSLV